MLRNLLMGTASFLPLFNAEGGAGGTVDPAGGADPTAAAAAAAGDAPAPAAGVDPGAGDPPPPAAPAAGDGGTEHGNKGKQPWFLNRISEETAARRRAEAEAQSLREMLAAKGVDPAAAPAPAPGTQPAAQPAPQPGTDQFNTAVRTEAARLRLVEDSTDVRNAGVRDFGPEFGQTLQIMNAVGATTDDFVLDLIAVDKANAHKIIAELAKDPERAANLAGMNTRQRTAELTRMSIEMTKPGTAAAAAPAAPGGAKAASAAPRPAPQINPGTTKTVDWRADEASDEDFTRGFNETMAKRSARR